MSAGRPQAVGVVDPLDAGTSSTSHLLIASAPWSLKGIQQAPLEGQNGPLVAVDADDANGARLVRIGRNSRFALHV
jgi:hypothetical protein